MITFRVATIIALISVQCTANAGAGSVTGEVEQAARALLARQAESAGLVEPQFDVAVVAARPAPPCAQPVTVEALDTRQPARMRFAVRCPDAGGWRYEYVVRGRLSAMVAVAAAPVAANEPLTDGQVALERRDISAIADPISAPEQAVGQTSRRVLRTGDILRSSQLAEVSTSGEALDGGSRGAIVRVRNSGSGQVVRMRVTGAGTVEPVAGQALIR
jgi:flagella basal body P-ring formation protein FlgA